MIGDIVEIKVGSRMLFDTTDLLHAELDVGIMKKDGNIQR